MDDTEKELIKQLYRSSVLDALTGAYNREYFNTVITTEFKQAQSTRKALSLLLLDVDHFKNINDSFGHSAGDAVLIELVERLRLRLRPSDVLCRYGGEEFVIILRATEIDAAAQLAERLRLAVRTVSFVHTNVVIPVSISIGCASTTCRGESESPDALTAIADQRLYAAKHAGRDRVVYSD
jgi:diguanylate cyclase (GGDEF)-like protein